MKIEYMCQHHPRRRRWTFHRANAPRDGLSRNVATLRTASWMRRSRPDVAATRRETVGTVVTSRTPSSLLSTPDFPWAATPSWAPLGNPAEREPQRTPGPRESDG